MAKPVEDQILEAVSDDDPEDGDEFMSEAFRQFFDQFQEPDPVVKEETRSRLDRWAPRLDIGALLRLVNAGESAYKKQIITFLKRGQRRHWEMLRILDPTSRIGVGMENVHRYCPWARLQADQSPGPNDFTFVWEPFFTDAQGHNNLSMREAAEHSCRVLRAEKLGITALGSSEFRGLRSPWLAPMGKKGAGTEALFGKDYLPEDQDTVETREKMTEHLLKELFHWSLPCHGRTEQECFYLADRYYQRNKADMPRLRKDLKDMMSDITSVYEATAKGELFEVHPGLSLTNCGLPNVGKSFLFSIIGFAITQLKEKKGLFKSIPIQQTLADIYVPDTMVRRAFDTHKAATADVGRYLQDKKPWLPVMDLPSTLILPLMLEILGLPSDVDDLVSYLRNKQGPTRILSLRDGGGFPKDPTNIKHPMFPLGFTSQELLLLLLSDQDLYIYRPDNEEWKLHVPFTHTYFEPHAGPPTRQERNFAEPERFHYFSCFAPDRLTQWPHPLWGMEMAYSYEQLERLKELDLAIDEKNIAAMMLEFVNICAMAYLTKIERMQGIMRHYHDHFSSAHTEDELRKIGVLESTQEFQAAKREGREEETLTFHLRRLQNAIARREAPEFTLASTISEDLDAAIDFLSRYKPKVDYSAGSSS